MSIAQFLPGAVMAFLFGTAIGSFLNVCIYRLPHDESLITPPSHCPSCNTRLRSRDLVPLLSFLALRGKCRYCGTRISWRYFTIEFITGLLFIAFWVALALKYPHDIWTTPGIILLALAWIFASCMVVTFMIDLDTTYVIEPVTWIAMGAGLGYELMGKWIEMEPVAFWNIPYLPAAVPGMVIGFLVFIAMNLFGQLIFRKPSMGLGDAFIGAAIGAMLGPQVAVLSFGIAVLFGAVIGIVLMIAGALHRGPAPTEDEKPRPTRQKAAGGQPAPSPAEEDEELPQGTYMPFGPFLTASAVFVALAPQWFVTTLANFWHWWLYNNPLMP